MQISSQAAGKDDHVNANQLNEVVKGPGAECEMTFIRMTQKWSATTEQLVRRNATFYNSTRKF